MAAAGVVADVTAGVVVAATRRCLAVGIGSRLSGVVVAEELFLFSGRCV